MCSWGTVEKWETHANLGRRVQFGNGGDMLPWIVEMWGWVRNFGGWIQARMAGRWEDTSGCVFRSHFLIGWGNILSGRTLLGAVNYSFSCVHKIFRVIGTCILLHVNYIIKDRSVTFCDFTTDDGYWSLGVRDRGCLKQLPNNKEGTLSLQNTWLSRKKAYYCNELWSIVR
jgi:hypothetical protein